MSPCGYGGYCAVVVTATKGGLAARARRAALRACNQLGWYPRTVIRGGAGEGLRISLRQASADYTAGTNELPVQQAVVENLSPGDVFYDIGSNVGFFSLVAARTVGAQGHVYAFEPLPLNARCIRANAAANRFDNVTVVETAVGAAEGTEALYVTAHPGGATLSRADSPPDVTGTIPVTVTSIDRFVADDRHRPPSLVKIDVEGLELEVVKGMVETLRVTRPVVLCELDDVRIDGVVEKLAQFEAAMAPFGYTFRLLESSYAPAEWHVAHVVATPQA